MVLHTLYTEFVDTCEILKLQIGLGLFAPRASLRHGEGILLNIPDMRVDVLG